ncbi:MAG: hypothetical protein JST14_00830 [Bacteroidetes bacterium]|nr:hypothetical protein [Bacteroidota bacterium]MBS1977226.1 hypothetical protein [Bacteroidota bacterium]
MLRKILILVGLYSVALQASAQVRYSKLTLKPKEVFELKGSDILVVDTLTMMDSSKIILNKLKAENYIHAKVAIFHKGAFIDGKGIPGIRGRNGHPGVSVTTPCTDGKSGLTGSNGTNGAHGLSLFLYFSDIRVPGSLYIDVSGGDGADGGQGGDGGGGGPGTRLCRGGSGGSGGSGANGGNGGDGGNVTFYSRRIPELRTMLNEKIFIRTFGGNQGQGGDGGAGGYSGLSPADDSKMDGKHGRKGPKGLEGNPGKPGAINFDDK